MSARGFTLVEVLVALVIVAAGASAVLSSLNSAATSTVYLRDKTFAQWIAGNRIAETRLATSPPQSGTTEGELDYAGRRWQWRQQIADFDLPGLRRIDVSVRPAGVGSTPGGATAGDAKTGGGDWMLTLGGVLGRDLAPPGGPVDWEPPAAGPAAGSGTGAANADSSGNGSASPRTGGAAAGNGSTPRAPDPGITQGPRT